MSETAKKPMNKFVKWAGIIFFGLALIGIFAGPDKKEPGSDEATSATTAQEPLPIYKTTASRLYADYDANEVAADEKMKGDIIQVTGIVESIDKDFTDSIVVHLATSNEFESAGMAMQDSEKQRAIALRKGQKITVQCEKMTRIIGSPQGSDCVFMN